MDCNFCEGVAHPATGCQYTENMIACGPCTRRFWAWFEQHSNPRPILNRREEFVGPIPWCSVPVAIDSYCFDLDDIYCKPRNRRCCGSTAALRCTRPKKKVVSFYTPGPG